MRRVFVGDFLLSPTLYLLQNAMKSIFLAFWKLYMKQKTAIHTQHRIVKMDECNRNFHSAFNPFAVIFEFVQMEIAWGVLLGRFFGMGHYWYRHEDRISLHSCNKFNLRNFSRSILWILHRTEIK